MNNTKKVKKKIKIRLVQMKVKFEVSENIKTAIKLADFDFATDIDVIVFPELFTCRFCDLNQITTRAYSTDHPVIKKFQSLAQKSNTNIVLGSLALKSPPKNKSHDFVITNSTLIIDRKGEIISRYDKNNLFPLMKEPQYFTSGKIPHWFLLDQIHCSSIICYDLRFPEILLETLKLGLFDLLFIPAQWPNPREEIFKTLVRARAIENQCYVIFVNRTGTESIDKFSGQSVVADPLGELILETDEREAKFDLEIELKKIDHTRKKFPTVIQRKKNLS